VCVCAKAVVVVTVVVVSVVGGGVVVDKESGSDSFAEQLPVDRIGHA
jgi:hypothetical protein